MRRHNKKSLFIRGKGTQKPVSELDDSGSVHGNRSENSEFLARDFDDSLSLLSSKDKDFFNSNKSPKITKHHSKNDEILPLEGFVSENYQLEIGELFKKRFNFGYFLTSY
ncbi:hypothetical protein AYI68_g4880 [Smittium mucronatum]|uniref:Uncharacterized protein n=1 Tax=Smittium mucronatum TaxID=133383 RepID=A0A1R0GVT8_9FUNG|nr:hypothetical protein AYI68_g4880 [Smittium mucronatum]